MESGAWQSWKSLQDQYNFHLSITVIKLGEKHGVNLDKAGHLEGNFFKMYEG